MWPKISVQNELMSHDRMYLIRSDPLNAITCTLCASTVLEEIGHQVASELWGVFLVQTLCNINFTAICSHTGWFELTILHSSRL